MNDIKKMLTDQKGQAIFEMILFLPFLLFLYTIFYTAGNSINGSINQQKAVRGYFYNLSKNNSYILNLTDLKDLKDKGQKNAGFFAIGWAAKEQGESRFAPCFRFSSMLNNDTTEECDAKRQEEDSSRFIRLFTFYGVCGAFYSYDDSTGSFTIDPRVQNGASACTIH